MLGLHQGSAADQCQVRLPDKFSMQSLIEYKNSHHQQTADRTIANANKIYLVTAYIKHIIEKNLLKLLSVSYIIYNCKKQNFFQKSYAVHTQWT